LGEASVRKSPLLCKWGRMQESQPPSLKVKKIFLWFYWALAQTPQTSSKAYWNR